MLWMYRLLYGKTTKKKLEESVEYPFNAITPKLTLTLSGSTC